MSNSGGTWTIDDPLMTKAEPSYNNQPLFYTIEKFNTLQTAFYGTGTVTLETTIKSE